MRAFYEDLAPSDQFISCVMWSYTAAPVTQGKRFRDREKKQGNYK